MKTAIILFNLGGPDGPAAVRPFLFNLFHDPAIFRLPQPFRWLLARLVSSRRTPTAQAIYAHLGGGSPILGLTEAQAALLQEKLGADHRVFVCMRYWHPMSAEVARQVADYAPDRVLLLPLYPQFSTTTTASSVKEWQRAAAQAGLHAPSDTICCYPTEPFFARAHAALIHAMLQSIEADAPQRLLFSAHGLPEKIVRGGDPYQWQVEQSVAAVLEELVKLGHRPDWTISYQSRVGPLAWIGPSTESEIARAGAEGTGLVVIPIAFVSEHSETLVELDIEYGHLAQEKGVPSYHRVPALGTQEDFIDGLAQMVRARLGAPRDCAPPSGQRLCPPEFSGCACRLSGVVPGRA